MENDNLEQTLEATLGGLNRASQRVGGGLGAQTIDLGLFSKWVQ